MSQTAHKVIVQKQITPTIYTAGAMTAGDAMHTGDIDLTNVLQGHYSSGRLIGVSVLDLDKKGTDFDILLFNQALSTSTITAGAAFDLADAEGLYFQGHVAIAGANYGALNDNSIATKECSIPVVASSRGTRDLYCVLVSRDTDTFSTATALTINLFFEQD